MTRRYDIAVTAEIMAKATEDEIGVIRELADRIGRRCARAVVWKSASRDETHYQFESDHDHVPQLVARMVMTIKSIENKR